MTQHRRFDRYMRVVLAAMQHQRQSQAEHRALLAACAQRDAPTATRIMERHIEENTDGYNHRIARD